MSSSPADQRRESVGHPFDVLAAIAVGGALGAVGRLGLAVALPHAAAGWPWATLLTNATGCLAIGVLMVVITEVVTPHRLVRPFLGVGVLGGYTTFSTYTVDVLSLAHAGRVGPALGYLAATPVVGILACAVGVALTRSVAARRVRDSGSPS